MGSKYTKQFPTDGIAELPIDNDHPWELAELLYNRFNMLCDRVDSLDAELKTLRTNPTRPNPTPKISWRTQTKPQTVAVGCQTWDECAMEIEQENGPRRRPIRRPFYYKSTFFTKIYVRKRVEREKMEVEVPKREHTTRHPKKIPKKQYRLVKVYVAKEVMQIETKKVEPAEKTQTPLKKARKKKKREKRKKETPKEWAPQRKKKKDNTPREDLVGPVLNLDKNLTQPMKFSLITDFFSVLKKVTEEEVKAPDL